MSSSTLFTILLFLGMLSWGGSWPASKFITTYTSGEIIVFWRFLLALLTFIPILAWLKIPLKITPRALGYLLVISLFNSLYALLFIYGVRYGMAGAGGVLVTTLIPIFTYLSAYVLHANPIARHEGIGLVLGLLSGLFLLNPRYYGDLLGGGNLFFLAAALTWTALTLTTQRIRHEVHPVAVNFYSTFFSFLSFLPLLWLEDRVMEVWSFDGYFWGNLLFISCLSMAFGTTIYYQAVAKVGGSKASSFGLLVPMNALLLSWLFLEEIPTFETLIGGALALGAIYLLNLYRPRAS